MSSPVVLFSKVIDKIGNTDFFYLRQCVSYVGTAPQIICSYCGTCAERGSGIGRRPKWKIFPEETSGEGTNRRSCNYRGHPWDLKDNDTIKSNKIHFLRIFSNSNILNHIDKTNWYNYHTYFRMNHLKIIF